MKKTHGKSLKIITATIAVLAAASPALAGIAPGWWAGTWNCTIDGRPARMKWVTVEARETECEEDACPSSLSSAAWQGSFSDNGAAWLPLVNPRVGNKGGVFFNHADGNKWYLPKPSGTQSAGWTTWNNQRLSLVCWK